MARYFVKASSQKLEATSSPITGYPFTMSCWINPTTMAATQTAMSVGHGTNTSQYFALGTLSTAKAFFESANSTTNDILGTAVMTNGSWNHIAVVATSTAVQTLYVNGLSDGTSATGLTPTGLNRTDIGALNSGGVTSSFFDGAVAVPAIWNVSLNVHEIRAIFSGTWTGNIRPQSLVFLLDDRLGMPVDTQQKAPLAITGATFKPNNFLGNRIQPPYLSLLGYKRQLRGTGAAISAANNPAFYIQTKPWQPSNAKAIITDY